MKTAGHIQLIIFTLPAFDSGIYICCKLCNLEKLTCFPMIYRKHTTYTPPSFAPTKSFYLLAQVFVTCSSVVKL